jgi:hypothetical protein
MTSRDVDFQTLSLNSVTGGDELTHFEYAISQDLLVEGENIIAVEIHQASPSSTDMGFDLMLTGTSKNLQEPRLIGSEEMEAIIEGAMTITASLERSREIPDLRINEIMASNSNGIEDEFGDKEDWIEIYNSGAEAVDLGGLFLTDTLGEPGLWEIPASEPVLTTVDPGGFIVFWADNQPEQGPLHLGFKLRKSGEQVGLFKEMKEAMILLDSVSYSDLLTDVSLARYPDASGPWVAFAHPTPLDPNFYLGTKGLEKPSGEFNVYPNPTSGKVNIGGMSFETVSSGGGLRVSVIDFAGRTIMDKRIDSPEGLEIDLSAHKEGIYLIRISTGGSYFTKSVILMK